MATILALIIFAIAVLIALGAVLVVSATPEMLPEDLRPRFDRVQNWALGLAGAACSLAAVAGWLVG